MLMMQIGPYTLAHRTLVAPMAGVTDRPFRKLCRRFGAAYAVSEMLSSRPELQNSVKSSRRADHCGEPGPIVVQIAGTCPVEMADAARLNADRGAQIIDINMGCPAKKVCKTWAGSALMQNEALALSIIQSVVNAVAPRGIPVTLKMRTGWDAAHKNAPILARAAEDAGIAMLVVHGRTREQKYAGCAEYDTIAEIKTQLRIPVVANGDIDSPEKAHSVLAHTGADAIMIGRAAQGQPWLFRQIQHYLEHGEQLSPPQVTEIRQLMQEHLLEHYDFYGDYLGVRSARKHIAWYVQGLPGAKEFTAQMHRIEDCATQLKAVQDYFLWLEVDYPVLPARLVTG